MLVDLHCKLKSNLPSTGCQVICYLATENWTGILLQLPLPVKRQSSNSSLITAIKLSLYKIEFNEALYDFIITQIFSTLGVGLIFTIIQAICI